MHYRPLSALLAAPNAMVSFSHYGPSLGLQGFVSCYWHMRYCAEKSAQTPELLLLPDGCVDVTFRLNCDSSNTSAFITGASMAATSLALTQSLELIAIRFLPGGAYSFLRNDLADFQATWTDAVAVWGSQADRLTMKLNEARTMRSRLQLIERFLYGLLNSHRSLSLPPAMGALLRESMSADSLLCEAESVLTDDDEGAVSERSKRRRFAKEVGLPPVKMKQIMRLQKLIALLQSPSKLDLAGIAVECGYYDQAHLTHQVMAMTSLSPLQLARLIRR